MLWEVEISPSSQGHDYEGQRVLADAQRLGIERLIDVRSSRTFLVQGDVSQQELNRAAADLLCDSVVERMQITALPDRNNSADTICVNVLFHPGVTDSVADSAVSALRQQKLNVTAVATCRRYRLTGDIGDEDRNRLISRVLSNEAIEYTVTGSLQLTTLAVGSEYEFKLRTVAVRGLDDEALQRLSFEGQLYLSLAEMQTIREHFRLLDRDPTDVELETIAQTWSEHCSHKTLAGRIHYQERRNGNVIRDMHFENMLQETIFRATEQIRESLGDEDWCVSVFRDNAGVVTFDDSQSVCFKVETHNHPSAIEPYGGANTGLGGVIRDPMGTGLGARPVCSTDVFCFASPDYPADRLPPGVLHPRAVMQGVVAGVRDYGNRMGIPTVNGAVYFDNRYLGNPLVYCGNVAMIPADMCEERMQPGDLIVSVGGRTGRDGIHGATFSSAELTEDSEVVSGGAVQIGNAITEKMVLDVLLQARDRGLCSAITDCGAGGFSSAVGEMGEETGAEVWLDRCPLKYPGLTYTEIWISEAQERMVLAVPEIHRDAFIRLSQSEGVEATVIGRFTSSRELVLKYEDREVGRLSMSFLHDGRPPVIRDATFDLPTEQPIQLPQRESWDQDLKAILSAPNVASKEWIIRQYDHEVQAGSVIKPLAGIAGDGPSDAAVVRPDLNSSRGLVVSCGMNPHYGDLDPWWMAASAIDEAVRNCVAVGADPDRIAILDNFCWGNTEHPETLGSLVRAALACHHVSVALGTPFISGKDSLNNEFSWKDENGNRQTVAIPSTLLISALGQVDDVEQCVTMDLKEAGNRLYLVGTTKPELGGSHFALVNGLSGGAVPRVDSEKARTTFAEVHTAIRAGAVRSCHDLSEGGLAVAVAEMAFAGGLGARVLLSGIADDLDDDVVLFSESNSRFLAEVAEDQAEAFESCFVSTPLQPIGVVVPGSRVTIENRSGTPLVNSSLKALKQAWQGTFAEL